MESTDNAHALYCAACGTEVPWNGWDEVGVDECADTIVVVCDACFEVIYESVMQNSADDAEQHKTEEQSKEVPGGPDSDEEEVAREVEEEEERWCEANDDGDFDVYAHFGIPSDVPSWEQDAMLEAAMGS